MSLQTSYAYGQQLAVPTSYLSNAMILGGFSEIDGGKGVNFRIVNGFCVYRSGRPVRAKELGD